ncbi:hypothetical protein CK510_01850, partial [Brunnivagina elsteri CCALA 953]
LPPPESRHSSSQIAFPARDWERDMTQKWYEPKASKFHQSQQPRLEPVNERVRVFTPQQLANSILSKGRGWRGVLY